MGMIGTVMRIPDGHHMEPPGYMVVRETMEEEAASGTDPSVISLEKLWHGLHFLLSGDASGEGEGLGELILGGEDVGDPDEGLTKLVDAGRVTELHDMLAALSDEALRQSFDPEEFSDNDIYPDIWDEDADELWDELQGYLDALRKIVEVASERGEALLVWVR